MSYLHNRLGDIERSKKWINPAEIFTIQSVLIVVAELLNENGGALTISERWMDKRLIKNGVKLTNSIIPTNQKIPKNKRKPYKNPKKSEKGRFSDKGE